jgi:pimeloyl-ACP methyl ester carboxylesterase
MQYIDVSGLSIAFRRSGQGPALVLLHGFLCDSRVWADQISQLSEHFTIIAWDAPGAGRSADPPTTFTTADYVRSLLALLNATGVDRAHVVGLSWGGILAQEFYRRHEERVQTLVLADTYAGWRASLPENTWKERLATCLEDANLSPDLVAQKFLPGVFYEPAPPELHTRFAEIVRDFHPIGFKLMSLSSAEVDTTDLLPSITVPTLLVWGDGDRRSPRRVAEQFRDAIPNATLVTIPNAGHLVNMEQPEQFNQQIRRFCLSA